MQYTYHYNESVKKKVIASDKIMVYLKRDNQVQSTSKIPGISFRERYLKAKNPKKEKNVYAFQH